MNRFASFAKAAPWLLMSLALIGVTYVAFNPEAPVDPLARQQVNAITEAVNGLPKVNASVGQPPDEAWISERVINLPEDGGQWGYIFIRDGSPESQRVADEMNKTPRLQSLVSQTHFYELDPGHPWVQQHRRGYPLPLLLLQRPSIESGGTNAYTRVYEQWGSGIPADGERLADDIAKMIARPCPKPGPTPTPQPAPQPTPPPNNVPLVPLAPDEVAPPPEEEDGLEWLIYALIAAGGLGGAGLGVKREFSN